MTFIVKDDMIIILKKKKKKTLTKNKEPKENVLEKM